ncbi:hypothetical protein NM688_g1163 [Phlebia brevispora]|uniref:Uncharacterized protein n=1 Tax=Phlebia brevispora TaxID=194682 RepID=A0ACC1TCL8_9APHY|nr:hypothetical protein NM688_g1163 [Phlebia brevispora]
MTDSQHVLLSSPTKYNIEDSNIALLGSDLEKTVREHAGDKETAWEEAEKAPGTQIWRVEKFAVKIWPKERFGSFYDGDSYIVLHTYKKTHDTEQLSYNLHFWIGAESTQDEAGTAAYKAVELDDHLGGQPVQYREIQGFESPTFISYFHPFLCLRGGVSTGFHHVSSLPPDNTKRFYRIVSAGSRLLVREVPAEGTSLVPGDAYLLDMGVKLWQLNTKGSVGKERFKAAEFAQSLVNERRNTAPCEVQVFDEGGQGAWQFLSELGLDTMPSSATEEKPARPPTLYRLSDATGTATFDAVDPVARSSLASADAFLLDDAGSSTTPAIYVWIGAGATLNERRLAVQYAQAYLYREEQATRSHFAISIVKMNEGHETEAFLHALGE